VGGAGTRSIRLLPEDRPTHAVNGSGYPYSCEQRRKVLEMIIMPRNKKWRDLTAPQKAPFVLRGIVQFALLVAALADIYRRPAEEINGSKWLWVAAALVNFMGIGPIAYFHFGRKRV
jgi:Phospholipase_D-nuclease N-terminal